MVIKEEGKEDKPQKHPIVERVRVECTDCGGLIDRDMAFWHDDEPYCGECNYEMTKHEEPL